MTKVLPFTEDEIRSLAEKYPTPFHVYDEATIRKTVQDLNAAFAWAPGFKNYYAVKACPNPKLLDILREEGCGADCSSLPEIMLSESVGIKGENIMFTSNDTPINEFAKAKQAGAILNLDDITHIDFINDAIGLPEFLCFRYNPGKERKGNVIIGNPEEAKYGLTKEQLFEAYRKAQKLGVKRFGLHTMVVSNCIEENELVETAKMIFSLAAEIKEKLGIKLEMVNLGGGIGVAYKPTDKPVDLFSLGRKIETEYKSIVVPAGLDPLRVVYECGRVITGPAGFLVCRVLHQKNTYKKYIGVDACMANLMRPALYGAYHHITTIKVDKPPKTLPKLRNIFSGAGVVGKPGVYDVVGGLCENNDKFAIDRELGTDVDIGDLLVIHDTGAHGHAMGFNYNGKLRSAEYLKKAGGDVVMIRRAEKYEDLFSTLQWSGALPGRRIIDRLYFKNLVAAIGGLVGGACAALLISRRYKWSK